MSLQANSQGVLSGKFTIPANVPAGVKNVEFLGNGGSRGTASFTGQGTLTTEQRQMVTRITDQWWDPLAQTFSLAAAAAVGGVDLWFTDKGTSQVVVQIRGVVSGVPNNLVYGEARIMPSDISLTSYTRVQFDSPVWVGANTEYAIVVLTNDAKTALAIAELGKWDQYTSKWVTSQPYQVGVLLSSSNASTWTPHQDKDMAFRLLKAVFNQDERVINLGNVAVSNATDLMLLSLSNAPTFDTSVVYSLGLPGGSTVTVSDGQPVRLPAAVTGNVAVSAKLAGSATSSPTLSPGTQLVAGVAAKTAEYVTVGIPAGNNSRVRVIIDATLPSGAGVAVKVAGIGASDAYADVPFLSSSQLTSDKQELIYEAAAIDKAMVKIKLVLSGTSSARPLVENLRIIVI